MESLSQHETTHLESQPEPHKPRFFSGRSWRRNRKGRLPFSIVMFLLGIVVGVLAMLLYAFLIAGNGQPLVTPRPSQGSDIVVQVDSAYIAHLVETKLQATGMPGEIKNVQAQLANGDEMTITGDDEFGLLGISIT
ncbi:MAG: hypothetical protein M3Z24_07430, partial [Chloroflexota bacterium]|nr:hypothetical protein [Chloroflexota bacterium]